ncbi:hypothetical protein CY658_04940 [Variovorax sp. RO1]|uniref:DUF1367 family protein n=1 Tax=Variovorax sp. RO1 TaxID=2066034 RepID=UPI000C7183C6|nr:DUF1367 family protein [Variovorax sp. RO1]PLC06383.1 hypothetical protein CY658_04940 [Variovorax sp. RO1]
MKAILIRTPGGLRGSTPADQDAWSKFRRKLETMKPGKWLRVEFSSPRNGRHHRKLMALLQLVAENSETYNTVEKALVAVKLVTGHFDLMADPKTGEIVQVPKSVSYEAMDQEGFDVFYSAAIDGVLQHILPQMDEPTANRLMDMIVEGWA